jgi:hypothetical protein
VEGFLTIINPDQIPLLDIAVAGGGKVGSILMSQITILGDFFSREAAAETIFIPDKVV